jgi:recombination protein RecA
MSDDQREMFAKAKGVATTARDTWRQVRSDRLRGSAAPSLCGEVDLAAGLRVDPLGSSERWGLAGLRGRLIELSARGAAATLTAAIDLVLEAQRASEPVAWITLGNATFYPPDAADSGVDLSALAVVRVHDATAAARAAERLLRSAGFGLVVLDFGGDSSVEVPIAHQGRLVTLAQAHDAAVVCITEKPDDAGSLGSLISLRAEALRLYDPEHGYHVTLRALKDKRRGPGWTHRLSRTGPPGA